MNTYKIYDIGDEFDTRLLGKVEAPSLGDARKIAFKKFRIRDRVQQDYISAVRVPEDRAFARIGNRKEERALVDDVLSKRKGQGKAKRPVIGRRKTVRMSAKGLMSKGSRRKAKSAMFRMNQKAKLLACHACNRSDFATEKSLKRHTEKFHTPGKKSPKGFRTARDPQEWYILLFDSRGAFSSFVTVAGDKTKALARAKAYRDEGYAKVEVTKDYPSLGHGTPKEAGIVELSKHTRSSRKWAR